MKTTARYRAIINEIAGRQNDGLEVVLAKNDWYGTAIEGRLGCCPCFGKGVFVAAYQAIGIEDSKPVRVPGNLITYSNNGTDWNKANLPGLRLWNCVFFESYRQKFYLFAANSRKITTSDNGIAWTEDTDGELPITLDWAYACSNPETGAIVVFAAGETARANGPTDQAIYISPDNDIQAINLPIILLLICQYELDSIKN